DDRIAQDRRVTSAELPGLEERGPVDELRDLGERVAFHGLDPKEGRRGRRVACPVRLETMRACLAQRVVRGLSLLSPVLLAAVLVVFLDLAAVVGAQSGAGEALAGRRAARS